MTIRLRTPPRSPSRTDAPPGRSAKQPRVEPLSASSFLLDSADSSATLDIGAGIGDLESVAPPPALLSSSQPARPAHIVRHTGDGLAPHLVPVFAKCGESYYCDPPLEQLRQMSEKDLSAVENLKIGRKGFGFIKWRGVTDIRGMNFDEDVVIEQAQVELYPNKPMPPAGQKLNKDAVICLHVETRSKDEESVKAKLKKNTQRFGGIFIDYDVMEQLWTFKVQEFPQ